MTHTIQGLNPASSGNGTASGLAGGSLADYAHNQARDGLRAYPGTAASWWVQYETRALMRFPIFATHKPSREELRRLDWLRFAPLVSYLVEPSEAQPANACVYLCRDPQYNLKKLDRNVQGNIKRGLREFQIRPITLDETRRFGEKAMVDTWRRHGWTTASGEQAQRYLNATATHCGNHFVGAWREDQLAAFVGFIEADDWVEVRVRFSMDSHLALRPNDALLFKVLHHYLVERGFRTVSAGASSIDPAAHTPGLHKFKLKFGFEAVPVNRVFRFHPCLRPLACHTTLRLMKSAAKRAGDNRKLAMAIHIMTHYLGHGRDFLPSSNPTALADQ